MRPCLKHVPVSAQLRTTEPMCCINRYGKVYKFDEGAQDTVTAYASFGGLLMALTGSYRHVANLTIGQNIYLLMRR